MNTPPSPREQRGSGGGVFAEGAEGGSGSGVGNGYAFGASPTKSMGMGMGTKVSGFAPMGSS